MASESGLKRLVKLVFLLTILLIPVCSRKSLQAMASPQFGEWGKCVKVQEKGLVDGCQAFYPDPARPLFCLGCTCFFTVHVNLLLQSSQAQANESGPSGQALPPSNVEVAAGASALDTSAQAQSDHLSSDKSADDVPPAKRVCFEDDIGRIPEAAVGVSVLVAAEEQPPAGRPSEPSSSKATRQVPEHYAQALAAIQREFPEETYGKLGPIVYDSANKKWVVECEACAPDRTAVGPGKSLDNFRKHPKTSKHQKKVASMEVKEAQKRIAEEEKKMGLREKRQALVTQYTCDGELT
jgi:hypothetical protein